MSAQVPALPLEADPVIAEAKKRARRRRLLAVATCLAAGAVAGTFAFRGSERPKPTVLAAPPCRGGQLQVGKPTFDGAGTGHVTENVALTNISGSRCSLRGRPSFVAVLPGGRRVAVHVGRIRNATTWRVLPAREVVLASGGAAAFHVMTDDGTGLDAICPLPLPTARFFVVPPETLSPVSGTVAMPYCHNPRRPLVWLTPVVAGRLDRYSWR